LQPRLCLDSQMGSVRILGLKDQPKIDKVMTPRFAPGVNARIGGLNSRGFLVSQASSSPTGGATRASPATPKRLRAATGWPTKVHPILGPNAVMWNSQTRQSRAARNRPRPAANLLVVPRSSLSIVARCIGAEFYSFLRRTTPVTLISSRFTSPLQTLLNSIGHPIGSHRRNQFWPSF